MLGKCEGMEGDLNMTFVPDPGGGQVVDLSVVQLEISRWDRSTLLPTVKDEDECIKGAPDELWAHSMRRQWVLNESTRTMPR